MFLKQVFVLEASLLGQIFLLRLQYKHCLNQTYFQNARTKIHGADDSIKSVRQLRTK